MRSCDFPYYTSEHSRRFLSHDGKNTTASLRLIRCPVPKDPPVQPVLINHACQIYIYIHIHIIYIRRYVICNMCIICETGNEKKDKANLVLDLHLSYLDVLGFTSFWEFIAFVSTIEFSPEFFRSLLREGFPDINILRVSLLIVVNFP